MSKMNPEELRARRERRDKRMARGGTSNSPGRKPSQIRREKNDPAYKIKKDKRRRLRMKYGRGQCTEIMLNGKQCPNGQYLVFKEVDGREKIYRAKWCFAHIPKEFRERWGVGEFGGVVDVPGRPRKPRPNDVLRELIENEMAEWLAPIRAALLAEKPTVVGNGRSARIEWSADHRTRLQAVESALDRVYGKPKQTTDVQGMLNLNADVQVPTDEVRQREVAQILAESGGLGLIAAAQNPASQN